MKNINSKIPIVILAGGYGIHLDSSGIRKSKANVIIHNKPLIYYVLLSYLQHGFRNFVITGSYQLNETQQLLKEAFENKLSFENEPFEMKFVDSGADAKTGTRIKKVLSHIKDSEHFGVTYSDSISLQNLSEEIKYHITKNNIGTITGVRLPTRFRVLGTRPGETLVRGFAEKPLFKGDYINGGFYFFKTSLLKESIWDSSQELVLETDILDFLVKSNYLDCYFFEGEWAYLDCERDLKKLEPCCVSVENRHLN